MIAVVKPSELPTLEIPLATGQGASIRPIVPDDAPLIEEGWSNLSESSRFARFGIGLDHLSKNELEYLTDVDQRSHVAIGAAINDEAAGVGRYVLGPDGKAEVALTVIDRYQRLGLGTALFKALVAVARGDGVESFCFEVQPSNTPVKRLLLAVSGDLVDPGFDLKEIELSTLPVDPGERAVVELVNKYRE